jgi:hypothetical protein
LPDWLKKLLGITPLSGADVGAEFMARAGWDEPMRPTPGWVLLLRSPYDSSKAVTSWFGGVPCAPSDFSWPTDSDGKPLHFIAQIDLASLQREPTTGIRPHGFPEQGALLVFIGRSYACRMLSDADMKRAAPVSLPDKIEPVRKHGFFSEKPTFNGWPIDPVPFLDTDGERPPFLPDPFREPGSWITNCGIAALEAEIVIQSLERELGEGRRFLTWFQETDGGKSENRVIKSKQAYHTALARSAPPLVAALRAWRESALSHPGETPMEPAQLERIFMARKILHDEIEENYPPKQLLLGRAKSVWEALRLRYPKTVSDNDFSDLPTDLRPFVTKWITDWRGHRLFGLEPAFSNNGEDRRGQDCLISIAADPLLDTVSEHEYGMSIWCPRTRLSRGQFGEGQFIRQNAG